MNWTSQLLPRPLLQFAWRGDRCYCPICDSHTRSFATRGHQYPVIEELSIVGAGRRAVDCRVCGGTDRDRLLWEYLFPFLQLSQTEISILHIAPELPIAQAIKQLITFTPTAFTNKTHKGNPKINYMAVDKHVKGYFYPHWVQPADIQENFITNPNHFDYILCGHVLEHVDDDIQAILQLMHKLKPSGKLILSVPIAEKLANTRDYDKTEWLQLSSAKKIELFGQKDHRRLYGMDVLNRWQFGTKTKGDNWEFYASQQSPKELKRQALNPKERLIIYANN